MPVDTSVDVQSADTSAQSRSGSWRPWVGQLASGRFARPVAVYIAAHAALIATIGYILARAHHSLLAALQGGDSGWYESIASHGYERQLVWLSPGVPAQMRLEFFPGLPLMIRLASEVTGASASTAGLLVSLVASLVAAAGIYAVVARYASDAVALAAVALWAAMPAAFLESMVYTEALFTAFAVWALYALLRHRWLTAAWLTVWAGLTRASAVTLIAVVCLACLVGAIRNRGRLRAILAMVIAPAGFAGYLLYRSAGA
jgi:Gpi18-like mannosyltransferase